MNTIRLMVVDDAKGFCKDVRLGLSGDRKHPSITFEVIKEVESGRDAIRCLELGEGKDRPDVILMDIEFTEKPRPNGVVATREITRRYPGIKVILCSFHDDLEYVKHGFRNRASGYFLKNGEEGCSDLPEVIYKVWKGQYYVTQRILAQMVTLLTEDPTGLTPREWEVAHLHVQGYSHKEIGDRLDISTRTVESHLGKVRKKWKVESREEIKKKLEERENMMDPGNSE